MATPLDLRHKGAVIRYDPDIVSPFVPELFDVGWLKEQGHHLGSAAGRGDAHFLSFGAHQMVLRAYLRGGLMRKINRDRYLRSGLEQSRSFREFALMAWMKQQGLPVPRVVAAQVRLAGPFYRAAILTERITNAQPLEDLLRAGALYGDLWVRVGKTVRQMHDAGVYHSDLNRRNILVDTREDVWLIDFDKCERRMPGPWTGENLSRLHRSLEKDDGDGERLSWTRENWTDLMAGYETGETR